MLKNKGIIPNYDTDNRETKTILKNKTLPRSSTASNLCSGRKNSTNLCSGRKNSTNLCSERESICLSDEINNKISSNKMCDPILSIRKDSQIVSNISNDSLASNKNHYHIQPT